MGRASVVQPEVLSLYLKIFYQVEGMPNVHSGVINKNDNMDENDDIYIMMKCMCVTKNHHFLLGVSCNHPIPP